MTDPLGMAIAAVAKSLTDDSKNSSSQEAERFLAQITGSARGELSAWFADHIRFRRLKSQLRLCERAQDELRKRGRAPSEVKLNVLLPLLEAAALEEDPAMAERWASLLANAADPLASAVLPSFPEILRQLTPLDATILDYVATHHVSSKMEDLQPSPVSDHRSDRRGWLLLNALRGASERRIGERIPAAILFVAVDNLVRLRLLEIRGEPELGLNRSVMSTAFAGAFVKACRFD